MGCVDYFSDKKSERAKDLHLVKKLAALLRAKAPRLGRCLSPSKALHCECRRESALSIPALCSMRQGRIILVSAWRGGCVHQAGINCSENDSVGAGGPWLL